MSILEKMASVLHLLVEMVIMADVSSLKPALIAPPLVGANLCVRPKYRADTQICPYNICHFQGNYVLKVLPKIKV